jgi:hypothetical protein
MASTSRKPPAMAPIRVFSDTGELLGQGEVPTSMLRSNPDRRALLRALQAPKRQPMSKDDVMGSMLRSQQQRRRGDSLENLQARVEQIEALLGIGRKPAPGAFDGLGIPPSPGGG